MTGFVDVFSGADGEGVKDPMRVASQSMKQNFPKKFYDKVTFELVDEGFQVLLDGRAIKTPGRNALALPTEATAKLLADEWDAQVDVIDPTTMPHTRTANTAIDGVSQDPQAVKEDLIRFAGTDLLCYRAEGPQGLLDLQRQHWDPVIDWAQAKLGARFELAEGIVHVAQPGEAIAAFGVHVGMIECPLILTVAHTMATLTGSALLSMTVLKRYLTPEAAWTASHVDEDWQISQWGDDDEAIARRQTRWLEMQACGQMLDALAA